VIPFLRLVAVPATDQQETTEPDGPRTGLRYLAGSRVLVSLVAVGAVTSLLGRNYSLSMAALVTGPLGASTTAYGVVTAALAAGGIAGSILVGRLRRPRLQTVVLLFIGAAGLQMLSGLSPLVLVLVGLAVPMAAAEAAAATATATLLQTVPPRHLRGRVLGAWRTASTGWGLAGPTTLGLLLQVAGPRAGLAVGGAAAAALLTGGLMVHRRRRSRHDAYALAA
jgi:hypothetical protein